MNAEDSIQSTANTIEGGRQYSGRLGEILITTFTPISFVVVLRGIIKPSFIPQ